MNGDFWRGRRVFLTGHTGFKGGWLALWLRRLGADITGYALSAPSRPSFYEVARVGGDLRSVTADVRDAGALGSALRACGPDVVFHLAAQSLVRPSYRDPLGTFATNVMGTVNLLEAARGVGSVRAVVIVTSDKCYENREWPWAYRENEAMGGHDPYSGSKGCAELATAAYRRSFFGADGSPGVATARAGNVIGGGDWAEDRLVPDMVRAFTEGRRPRIRSPQAVRPWQHVLEPLAGYLALARALVERPREFSEAWNFGPWEESMGTVGALADALAGRWPGAPGWEDDSGDRPHEAMCLKVDSSKARARLGWRPLLSVDRAVGWAVDWYRAYAAGDDPREAALRQIEAYEQLSNEVSMPC
jgi:CDP-glucose 4,6-dehydratase